MRPARTHLNDDVDLFGHALRPCEGRVYQVDMATNQHTAHSWPVLGSDSQLSGVLDEPVIDVVPLGRQVVGILVIGFEKNGTEPRAQDNAVRA